MAKYKIIPSSRTIVQSPISIGHKAEKGVEAIEFDLTAWVETYGSGTLTVIMRRWGDAIPYPIALKIDENNKATWVLSDTDTARAGMAYAQLSYIVGETVVKKSDIYTFRVMDSLTGEGEPPEAYESWLEHLTHLAAEAMAEVLDIEGIVTDKTLTVDGGIADGKATGDALALKADKSTTYTKAEVDQMIEDVEVETDTTLSVSGAPADAAETGRQIGLIKADLDAVNYSIGYHELDITGGTAVTCRIITSDTDTNGTIKINSNKDTGKEYAVTGGGEITVTANDIRNTELSFIKSSTATLSNGDTADLCTGETGPHVITAGTTEKLSVPSDCTLIFMTVKKNNTGGYLPTSAVIVSGGLAQQIEDLNITPDETLSVRGAPADSAETGARIAAIGADLYEDVTGDGIGTWAQGNYNASNGNPATSSKYIRLSNLDKSVKSLTCDSGYLISIYGFDASGTYLGMWKNDTAFSTSVSSGTLDYTSMDISKLWAYASKINIRLRSSSSEVNLVPSDASHVTAKMFTLQKIEINDNPCEFAGHDEICVFDKMLCIGDSLMEGGSKSPNVTDNPANAKRTVTRGMYSIPTFITKRFGVVTTNWGISGSTAKSWYNAKSVSEPDWGGYDSALIYIGSNDYTQITTGGMTVEESTAQSTTYLQNIITKLKTDNPGIRIFICTLNPGTTVGTLAPYRIPLMQAIRSIAGNDASVFCIDLNEYSSFQSGSAYSNGHPTAIGYQWMFREITNYINWWIAKHPADFKWIRYIGTSKAVTDNVTPEDDDDDGSYEGDVDTGNSGS